MRDISKIYRVGLSTTAIFNLECPIHLKVRLVDGTFDVRLLPFRIRTICSQGGGGGGLWAADALFLRSS